MGDRNPLSTAEAREALKAMVSRPRWGFFRQMALEAHGPVTVMQDLKVAAAGTQDMFTLGSLTAARLAAHQAVMQILEYPREFLIQMETEQAREGR